MVRPAPERTKVVVRKLPPTLQEEHFKTAIDEVCAGQYAWFSYVQGKYGRKSVRHSRAYLNFTDALQVYEFRAKFDGHNFVSERGVQFSCSVEYAPYQKVPKKTSKKDPKEGTLDKDAEFLEFVKKLESEAHRAPSTATNSAHPPTEENGSKPVTPLMQYLQDKWEGKLAPPATKSQKRQKAVEEALEPPPGFAPIVKSSSKGTKSGDKSQAKHATHEKAAAKQKPSKADQEHASTSGSQGHGEKKKAAGKKKVQGKKEGAESKGASRSSIAEAPTRILKKEATAQEPREPQAQPNQEERSKESGTAEAASRKPTKPVRVRAGFQVYTPRIRSEPAQPSSEQPKDAAEPAAASEPKTGAEGKSSRAKSGGSKRAKGKASQDGETTGQLESNLKPVEGVSQSGGGWDALIAAEASADTGPLQGIQSSSQAAGDATVSSEAGAPQPGRGRGRGRGGGRRHWRVKGETSG